MKLNPFADMGLSRRNDFPKHNDMVIVPGGFNPQRYYDKPQIDAILAGFTPSGGGGGASGFVLANGPEYTDTYVYVGQYKASTGAWYIYRRTLADNTRLYASGTSDYTTNWTNRGSLTYV